MAVRPEDISSYDPYLQIRGFARTDDIYLKMEHLNLAGSVKLKAARYLISDAEKLYGDSLADKLLVESSSGNLGIALAMICASRGYRFRCVVDPNTNRDAIAEMQAYGAEVIEVTDRDGNGGYLGTRIAQIHQWLAMDLNVVWLNQYENPSNPIAHMALTGPELASAFSRIDYLFIGVGTGGTIRGVVDYLGNLRTKTKIIAVDSVGSVTFGGPGGRRHIPGLGTSKRPAHVVDLRVDELELIDERDAVLECRRLARERGFFAGGSTGSVMAAIRRYADYFDSDDIIVGISPDSGSRYLNTIFNDEWVHQKFGTEISLDVSPEKKVEIDD